MTYGILLSPTDAQSGLARELKSLGARVIQWPKLSIGALEDNFALDEAIENLFGYDWLILKNEAAIKTFLGRFERSHQADELDVIKILSIGEQTYQALGETQIHVDVMANRSHDVFAALASYVGQVNGLNLVVPSANMTRESFARRLEEAGARVDSVPAYRTCSSSDELARLKALIAGGGIDFVAFTRAASVNEFASLFDTDDLSRLLAGVGVACLDTACSRAANGFGLVGLLEPAESSLTGLADLMATPR